MKVRAKPRIAVIFNRDFEGAEADPENRAREDIQNVATEVVDVLEKASYDVLSVGVRDDLPTLLASLRDHAPVTVFNLCESLRGDNRFEALVPMLLEFEGLVYTGSPPTTLLSALHKDRTKQLLLAAGVPTPRSLTFKSADVAAAGALRFPLFVKPTREDASVGISSASVVHDLAALEAQVRHVLMHYNQPVLVEEYIVGREINASVLERARGAPEVLPLHEIDFSDMPSDQPKIVSFEAKWVEESAQYHGTRPVLCQLSDEIRRRVIEVAMAAFRAVGLRDYGRVDLRLAADGTPYVIDVNPNCDLSSQGGGFARAARAAGMSYADLVLRLLGLALERRKDADTIPLTARSRGTDRAAVGTDKRSEKSVSPGGGGMRHRAPRGRAGSA
ncbi:MAG TPA: ATP-grasp domain-containing protein [Polyangia bacterium]